MTIQKGCTLYDSIYVNSWNYKIIEMKFRLVVDTGEEVIGDRRMQV